MGTEVDVELVSSSPKHDADEENQNYTVMEQWLDEHPQFVHDYFARKATRVMIDGWLIAHALSQTSITSLAPKVLSGSNSTSTTGSKSNSGTNTPIKKVSAFELNKICTLKPMVSTVDGAPTFLRLDSIDVSSANDRKSRVNLKELDEKELMYELILDVINNLDTTSLCHKILQNVSILVNADRCSLFLVKGDKHSPNRHLVSQLFDVNAESSLQDCMQMQKELTIQWGSGIVGHVAQTGCSLNIPDAYQDSRFNDEVDTRTGYKTHTILSVPIKDIDGDIIGVAQAVNRNNLLDEPFNNQDEKVFESYLAFCGVGLRNAQLYERSRLENKRNQVLLDLAKMIFEENNNLNSLIQKIMTHTESLLQCERCQVLLVDENSKGIFSQVFDLRSSSDLDNSDSCDKKGEPLHFPLNIGITGYVATTGQTLNIPDAYCDGRFDPEVDEQHNFRTRSILCMPIKNAEGQVIGVSQLVNKKDGSVFSENDQHLFEAFAIFCGLGISNTQLYERTHKSLAKQSVALDVLSYHATAPADEARRLRKMKIPSIRQFGLSDFGFNDFMLDDDSTLKACVRMFLDLGLVETFRISYEVLCRWLLSVKKNYRSVTYHNWRHAFNVAQTMYAIITTGKLHNLLSDLECLALIVGCLSHDLDHRGTNNQFQIKTMSPFAQLYSTSVMEHHHFDQCIMILSTKGNDILCNVNQNDYEKLISLIEHAILSTDLALYFRHRGEFIDIVDSKQADWSEPEHRELLHSMLMTACDVSAITKPWEVQKKVAELIAGEFFEQGDLEKKELKIEPIDMMNRDKKDELPKMQVEFIDSICMPVYQALSKVSLNLDPLLEGCKRNRLQWQHLAEHRTKPLIIPDKKTVHNNGRHFKITEV